MEQYIFSQRETKIVQSVPESGAFVSDSKDFIKFPHIREFGRLEFTDIRFQSFDLHYNDGIEICYIHKGNYTWNMENKSFNLYPGDCFVTFPWQRHGSLEGFLDLGVISWIIISPAVFNKSGKFQLGSWSNISDKNQGEIARILLNQQMHSFPGKGFNELFDLIHREISDHKFGFERLVNNTLDEIMIRLARVVQMNKCMDYDDKGKCILKLEQKLKNDLSYKWTLQDMSGILNMGQTSLNHLLKRETGFTPQQYLMRLRIEEAKSLMQSTDNNMTEIALNCGFSSSQHFSAAFKRNTGYRPKDYRNELPSLTQRPH
jgi:AraC-like DNA-binding protein/mannose-6-phosphate isomerase-like protein (cupin superfamily)